MHEELFAHEILVRHTMNSVTARTAPPNSSRDVPAIEVKNLTVSYGPTPALLDVSFAVPPGQLVGVIGPNGSGKSTLIKAILGFKKPDLGTVRLFGEPMEKARGRVAYVPQHGSVDWEFPVTVRDVALMARTARCAGGRNRRRTTSGLPAKRWRWCG